ncbi:hypothetical protein TrispH2_007752, partial [Trichoplax sp. H2]
METADTPYDEEEFVRQFQQNREHFHGLEKGKSLKSQRNKKKKRALSTSDRAAAVALALIEDKDEAHYGTQPRSGNLIKLIQIFEKDYQLREHLESTGKKGASDDDLVEVVNTKTGKTASIRLKDIKRASITLRNYKERGSIPAEFGDQTAIASSSPLAKSPHETATFSAEESSRGNETSERVQYTSVMKSSEIRSIIRSPSTEPQDSPTSPSSYVFSRNTPSRSILQGSSYSDYVKETRGRTSTSGSEVTTTTQSSEDPQQSSIHKSTIVIEPKSGKTPNHSQEIIPSSTTTTRTYHTQSSIEQLHGSITKSTTIESKGGKISKHSQEVIPSSTTTTTTRTYQVQSDPKQGSITKSTTVIESKSGKTSSHDQEMAPSSTTSTGNYQGGSTKRTVIRVNNSRNRTISRSGKYSRCFP